MNTTPENKSDVNSVGDTQTSGYTNGGDNMFNIVQMLPII
jgi:hypothetical protein